MMDDLIKRDDALALCDRYPYVEGVKSALENLPAIDPAAIREAALRKALRDILSGDDIYPWRKARAVLAELEGKE